MLKMKDRFRKKPENKNPENIALDNGDVHQTDSEDVKPGDEEMLDDNTEEPETPESEQESENDAVSDEANTELAVLQKNLAESQDKYLRLAAEFDNYRKRTMREKMELIQTAGESLLTDILPLVDDFERGIEAAAKAEDMDSVRDGIGLLYNKLNDFLTNHGVKEIKSMNEPFDADWHEAVANIPATSDDMKGKILAVTLKGYTLNDKIMRYPKVVVGE
jgi:molecular chaperone GrpE